MHLDIDERHLLRLGHGEEMLETEKDFSRYGRVNYVLQQRLALLKEVNRLQKSLGVQGDVSYTCETAGHFYLYQVLSRWEKFQDEINLHKKTVEGEILKWGASSRWSSSLYRPKRNSDQMTIGNTRTTLRKILTT